jgi:2-succinyl-5-enolpyruvyl-6-hydroxy-3-cyclohexene-1-carboxylate synthase
VNPSTALAQVLVDELVRGGVREAVLSPGSRSGPLAFALHDADRRGRLRLHVRIDERTAAFLALGLAKRSGVPVPVVTTSGTAAANLHPAVLEAAEAGVPLLVLTADRPPELRDTGANQTVDQIKLYGGAVRFFAEVGSPEVRAGQNAYWRALTCRALVAASGELDSRPGPVHLNVALREPLVPDTGTAWPEPLDGRVGGEPWTRLGPAARKQPALDDLPARTVVVIGDGGCDDAASAVRLATSRGWPVIAEPSAGVGDGANRIAAGELLLGVPQFVEAHRPERVLVIGHVTLSRSVGRFVAGHTCDVVGVHGGWPDAGREAERVLPAVPVAGEGAVIDPDWLQSWQQADALAVRAVSEVIEALPGLAEPAVAAEVIAAAAEGSLLVVGSSKPVRDLWLSAGRPATTVLANRGAAGIDGVVSTAVGSALAHQSAGGGHAYALVGDLTFLHDTTALVIGPDEPRPDLTVVVVNNDGGAIFGLLEQGANEYQDAFERVFGTPHGVDIASLCAATGTAHRTVTTRSELREALAPAAGLRVIEVATNRAAAIALDTSVRAAVAAALSA